MTETSWEPARETQRVSAWRSLRSYFRGDDFHGELRSAAIFSAFAVLGTAAFLLARQSDWLDDRDHLRYEFEANAYTLARDAHEHFAQGIPRNLTFLDEIAGMRLVLEQHFETAHASGARPARSCTLWAAGPTCREWEQELRDRKLEWAREVQHYASLCEEAAVIFEHVKPDWIRRQAAALGRDPPRLEGPGAGTPARPPADLAVEAAYIRALMDLMNDLSACVVDDNEAEFEQLVLQRGGTRPDPPAGGSADQRAVALQHEIYGEVDAAFTRCLREMDYGLQYHKAMREYGLDEGREGG